MIFFILLNLAPDTIGNCTSHPMWTRVKVSFIGTVVLCTVSVARNRPLNRDAFDLDSAQQNNQQRNQPARLLPVAKQCRSMSP